MPDVLIKQNTNNPTRKQNYNLVGSQLTAMLLLVFAIAAPEMYSRVPEDMKMTIGANLGGLIGFGIGWLVKERI